VTSISGYLGFDHSGWSYTEMVYLCADTHPSKLLPLDSTHTPIIMPYRYATKLPHRSVQCTINRTTV